MKDRILTLLIFAAVAISTVCYGQWSTSAHTSPPPAINGDDSTYRKNKADSATTGTYSNRVITDQRTGDEVPVNADRFTDRQSGNRMGY